jgi:hypothetical protein
MSPSGKRAKAAWRSRSMAVFGIARGGVERSTAPLLEKLVQAAKEPDEYQDRNRHSEKPEQQIASHRESSSFVVRELIAWHEVPNTFSSTLWVRFLQSCAWVMEQMVRQRIVICHGARALEVRFESVFGKDSK